MTLCCKLARHLSFSSARRIMTHVMITTWQPYLVKFIILVLQHNHKTLRYVFTIHLL